MYRVDLQSSQMYRVDLDVESRLFSLIPYSFRASRVVLVVKNLAANEEDIRDLGSIPGLGRSPGEGDGCPLQYSGLENSMDRIVHGVTKSQTRLSDFHFSCLCPNLLLLSGHQSYFIRIIHMTSFYLNHFFQQTEKLFKRWEYQTTLTVS